MTPLLIWLVSGALAAPVVYEERVPGGVGWTVDPDVYDALLEEAAGRKPDHATAVRLVAEGPDGVVRPLRDHLPEAAPVGGDEDERILASLPTDHPGPSEGGLSGKAVYASQCHGWIWYENLGRFSTQRGNVWDTVEDLHNPEGANWWLLRYLENAGAAVYTAKERDPTEAMAIVDDGDPGYAEVGAGFADGLAGFGDASPWDYGEDPFDAGGTRTFPADGGGVASWTPDVPEDGAYAVYVSWDADAAHATAAHYRLTHPGGTIDRWFDQTVHGSTWQYVETLWLYAGSSLTVELIGDGSEAGRLLSADAVRIGGGTGDVRRNGVTTGRPRWEEGAILYTQFNGAPASVYDPYGDGDGSDPTSRSKWADWEHPTGEDAVYLSWHSNAFDGSAYGTITYFAGGGADAPADSPAQCAAGAVTGSYSLARAVQDELIDAFRANWDAGWKDRGLGTACFSEVSPSNNDEMPAILVELAFHDNEIDALHLKHPKFRRDAARAMYRGIVRYFAERDGLAPVYLPEPPVGVSLVHDDDGALRLSWSPGPVGAPEGDAADGYRVFLSTDGRSWDEGADVVGTSATISADDGQVVYAKVAAVNAGGVSFASEVVGARRSPEGVAPILVVGAFDRLDRGLLNQISHPTLGDVVRMDLSAMNAFDVVVAHGQAIAAAGWTFDAVSDEVVGSGAIDLSAYRLVVWATGEESTIDETFSDAQQDLLRAYVEGGGLLWASGAEILWDLDYAGTESDRAFAVEVLGAAMAADASGSTDVDGEGLLADVGPMDFAVEDGAPYPVEWPDVLASDGEVLARYGDGGVAAATTGDVVLFGFPFETIGDAEVRAAVADALLAALLGDDPPEPDTDPTDPPSVDPPDGDAPTTTPAPPEEPGGCGCATTHPPGAALVMLGAVLAARRRRR